MKVYLGGPIHGCTDEEAKRWREVVKDPLAQNGHSWIDPMDRDYRGREADPGMASKIVNGDLKGILNCDVLLVNAWKPTWGTAMEIFFAYTLRLVIVVLPLGELASPWLKQYTDEIHYGSIVKVAEEL